MELVGSEFLERVDFYHRAWLPARALVEEAVKRRFEVMLSQPGGSLAFWGRIGMWGGQNPSVQTSQGSLCTPYPAWPLQEGTLSFWGH